MVHTFTTSDFGKTKGDMESPTVTKTADGLLVTTTGSVSDYDRMEIRDRFCS